MKIIFNPHILILSMLLFLSFHASATANDTLASCKANVTIQVTGNQVLFKDLNASKMMVGNTATRWTWHFGDGDSTTGDSVTHLYRSTGTYHVTLQKDWVQTIGYETCAVNYNYTVSIDSITCKANVTYTTRDNEGYFFAEPTPYAKYFLWEFDDTTYMGRDSIRHVFPKEPYGHVCLTSYSYNPFLASQVPPPFTCAYKQCDSIILQTLMEVCLDSPVLAPDSGFILVYTDRFSIPKDNSKPMVENSASATTHFGQHAYLFQQVEYWRWDFGDGEVSFLQSGTHQYKGPGEYVVQLTSARFSELINYQQDTCKQYDSTYATYHSCLAKKMCDINMEFSIPYYSDSVLSVMSASSTYASSIFPNPTDYSAVLKIDGVMETMSLQIFNIQGRLSKEIMSIANMQTLNLKELEPGMYFYIVSAGNKVLSRNTLEIIR